MSYDKNQATGEFNRWSESYDRSILQRILFQPSHKNIIARIIHSFDHMPIKILDVGCGTGIFAARIRAALPSARVWGVDLVAKMLERGLPRWREHAGSVQPVQGDSERLPFSSGSFDVVTCANSFHHYPDQALAVREMARVLRPGGKLLLLDGYRDNPLGWFIYDCCVAGVEGEVHHASARQFRELFEQAGLSRPKQFVRYGPAPFILNEGLVPVVRAPHIATLPAARTRARTAGRGVAAGA